MNSDQIDSVIAIMLAVVEQAKIDLEQGKPLGPRMTKVGTDYNKLLKAVSARRN